MDFVNVGSGKEEADSKLRRKFGTSYDTAIENYNEKFKLWNLLTELQKSLISISTIRSAFTLCLFAVTMQVMYLF